MKPNVIVDVLGAINLPLNAYTVVFTRACLSSKGADVKLCGVSMNNPEVRAM